MIPHVRWWARWLVRHFPGAAWRRVTHCRRYGHGPFLQDGECCTICYGPWFRESL